MGLLGGIMRSVINPATLLQVAMGPAGWASLAVRTIGTAIGQQLIQQLGQKLGLPQNMISMAQNTFATMTGSQGGPLSIRDAVSQLANRFDLSPSQQGQLERSANQSFDNIGRLLDSMARRNSGTTEEVEESGSVLMRIARVLGQLMDEKMDAMADKGQELGQLGQNGALKKDGNFNAEGQSKYGKVSGEMQALGQELGILSNALSNVLKSAGEGTTTLARKG
jgi:hypothetical protein